MPNIPATSVSLIRDIANDPQSARWSELYLRYSEPMAAFLKSRYPSVEPADVIQETMAALFERLPEYRYKGE